MSKGVDRRRVAISGPPSVSGETPTAHTLGCMFVSMHQILGRPYPRRMTTQSGSDIRAMGAVAGMIGPVLFTVGFVVQGWFRRSDYDPISETISALEAGPNGWVQQLNFFVFGILMMIFATGLAVGLRTRRRWIASAMIFWWGVGLLLAGAFPLRQTVDGETYDATGLHQPSGFVFFFSTWAGLAVLSWCLRSDPGWRSLSRYTLITSAALALLFVVLGVFAIPDSGPLHPWAGLLQRIYLALWFLCVIVLAFRLGRVSRSEAMTPMRGHSVSVV